MAYNSCEVYSVAYFPKIFLPGIQVIDMRWGVRDEATDDHQTMTICRDEVKFF